MTILQHIFLADGASAVVKYVLNALLRDRADGVAVPVPQYPLYSSSIELLGAPLVPGYLIKGFCMWVFWSSTMIRMGALQEHESAPKACCS